MTGRVVCQQGGQGQERNEGDEKDVYQFALLNDLNSDEGKRQDETRNETETKN
jgi:hypothetical protein